DLNLVGPLATVRYAVPHFPETGRRDVVVVGSAAAITPMPGTSIYSASKAGLRAAFESLRLELAPEGINATHVMPGMFETEGLGIGIRTGHRRRRARQPDDGEGAAVYEVGDDEDGEHHGERPERRARAEPAYPLRQLLGLRLPGVVPVQQHPGRDHHEGHERRLPQQRELIRLPRPQRSERHDLRVDVEPAPHAEDLEEGVVDETDDVDQRDQADQRVAPEERAE